MESTGWIKLHRKILDWEWWDDDTTFRLFIYLLLTANIKEKKWHGVIIPRGSLITSRSSLYDALNRNPKTQKLCRLEKRVTEQQLRTAIKRLKSTNEITSESTNEFTLITLVNYDKYQTQSNEVTSKVTSKVTSHQPAINQPSTTTKEYKESKEVEEKEKKIKKRKIFSAQPQPRSIEQTNADELFSGKTYYDDGMDILGPPIDKMKFFEWEKIPALKHLIPKPDPNEPRTN